MHLTEEIPSLLSNDQIVKDPEVAGDVFNTFFQAKSNFASRNER
jgi:hypothetical protein